MFTKTGNRLHTKPIPSLPKNPYPTEHWKYYNLQILLLDMTYHNIPISSLFCWVLKVLQPPDSPVRYDMSQHPSFPNWAHLCCNIQYPIPDIPEVFPIEHSMLQYPNHHIHLLERHRLQLANNIPIPDLNIRSRSNTPASNPGYYYKYRDISRIKPRIHHLLPYIGERPHQQRKSHRSTRKSYQCIHHCQQNLATNCL